MNRNGMMVWLFLSIAVLANEARAEPVLLASLQNRVSHPSRAPAEPEVSLILQIQTGEVEASIGTEFIWRDGDHGQVKIDQNSDPAFASFAALATDGINDHLFDGVAWERGGTFWGSLESDVFGGDLDLVGRRLEFVRIIVDRMEFGPWIAPNGDEGYSVDYDATYEFFGSVVPEPSTGLLCLSFAGAVYLARRKRL